MCEAAPVPFSTNSLQLVKSFANVCNIKIMPTKVAERETIRTITTMSNVKLLKDRH